MIEYRESTLKNKTRKFKYIENVARYYGVAYDVVQENQESKIFISNEVMDIYITFKVVGKDGLYTLSYKKSGKSISNEFFYTKQQEVKKMVLDLLTTKVL